MITTHLNQNEVHGLAVPEIIIVRMITGKRGTKVQEEKEEDVKINGFGSKLRVD